MLAFFKKDSVDGNDVDVLFTESYPALVRFCYGFLKDQNEAAELAQESFSRLWSSLSNVRSRAGLKPYLFTIAKNACLRHATQQREVAVDDEYWNRLPNAPHGESPELAEVRYRIIEQLVNELSTERERQLIRMYYFEEAVTTRDIAARLNLPHGTVTVTLKRVRAKLMKRFIAEMSLLGEAVP